MAEHDNRVLKGDALQVEKAQYGVDIARTAQLPNFDIYVQATQLLTPFTVTIPTGAFGNFPATGPVPKQPVQFLTPIRPTSIVLAQATQPLTQLHRIHLQIQEQELDAQLAQQQLRMARQNVVNQVKQGYYGILQAQSALDAEEALLRFDQELDQLTDRYLVQRVVLKSDSLQVKSQMADTQYQITTLEDNLDSAHESLNELMGRDLETPFRVEAAPPATAEETSLEEAHRVALADRPELQQALLKKQRAELDESVQKSYFWPDVTFRFRYLSLVNYSSFLPSRFVSVGADIDWDPFDWGRRRDKVALSATEVRQDDEQLREAQQQILLQVNSLWRQVREARARLVVVQMQQQTQQEKMRVSLNDYAEKTVLLKDVLQQRVALTGANSQYQQSLLNFWKARANFEKALGEE